MDNYKYSIKKINIIKTYNKILKKKKKKVIVKGAFKKLMLS